MTTFQAIIYAIVHGFGEILPISAPAHDLILSRLLGWEIPSGPFLGMLSLMAALALFVHFRHDWASLISSFLQVVLFRKRPMAPDERMPFLLAIASVPAAAAWYWTQQQRDAGLGEEPHLLLVAAGLLAFTALLSMGESFSRRNKTMFDWTWLDALIVGLGQALTFLPMIGAGAGRTTGALAGGLFRNYNREAAAKFALLAAVPALGAHAVLNLREFHLHSGNPMPGMSWMSFWIATVVSFFAALLAAGGMMKYLEKNSTAGYSAYRVFLAIVMAGGWWYLRRSGG